MKWLQGEGRAAKIGELRLSAKQLGVSKRPVGSIPTSSAKNLDDMSKKEN